MSLVKRTYVDQETVITAENLNAIQDAIIENEEAIENQGDDIGNLQDAVGDGALDPDFTATNLTGAANELKNDVSDVRNTLNHKADVIYDTASGDIASFPDGADGLPVKDLTVAIEPVQDLHGYDYPWPAGGGKNLLPLSLGKLKEYNTTGVWNGNVYTDKSITFTVKQNSNGSIIGIDVNGTATATASLSLLQNYTNEFTGMILTGSPSGSDPSTVCLATQYWNGGSYSSIDFETGSGITLSQSDKIFLLVRVNNGASISNAHFYPMIRLSTVSDATFAPYSNICPIIGWTGCKVNRTGKNLLPMTVAGIKALNTKGTWSGNVYTEDGLVMTVQVDATGAVTGIALSGTPTSNDIQFPLVLGAKFPADKYTLTGGINSDVRLRISDRKTGNDVLIAHQGPSPVNFTLNGSEEIRVALRVKNKLNVALSETMYPMVRFLTVSDSSYAPYTGTTIPISWQSEAGTVYGGTLELPSCVLTVDRKFVSFNSGWSIASNGVLYVDGSASDGTASSDLFACNMYPFGTIGAGTGSAVPHPKTVCVQSLNGIRFMIYDTTYTTAQQFNDFLANNPLQIVYKLATPLVIQLDPVTVTTLLGTNNIWADTGDSTVEYPADTKLYIDKKLAALVAALS